MAEIVVRIQTQVCPQCGAGTMVLIEPPPRVIECAACGHTWETDKPQQPRLFFEEPKHDIR